MNSAGTAAEAGAKQQISSQGGIGPRWRGDGQELYYREAMGGVTAVEIATSPGFRSGKPQPFELVPSLSYPSLSYRWDIAKDGKRFLAFVTPKSAPEPFTVVLNWQTLVRK